MPGKYSDFDFEADYEEESNGMFDSLFDSNFDDCPECDYEGPLELKKSGYTCPECRTLVLPHR